MSSSLEAGTATPSPGGTATTVKKKPEDFIFGKILGEGSFSSVYLAKDVKSGKEYAIKVCDKHHIIKEKKTESIHREKEIMTKLSANREPTAPFFVHLYATFQDHNRLYFVMTFAHGGELLKLLRKRKTLSLRLTQFYGAEIVQALRHMHKLLICHRDLKPENILLTEEGHILLTDFGSGKKLTSRIIQKTRKEEAEDKDDNTPYVPSSSRGRSNSFVGTAHYVSPEVLEGRYSDVGPAADLWALGCILYQFSVGITPFSAPNEYHIFTKIMHLDYTFPSSFDDKLKDLISSFLRKDFSQRLGAMDEEPYTSIQNHPFFEGVDFDSLHNQKVPLDEDSGGGDDPTTRLRKNVEIPDTYEPGFNPRVIAERFLRNEKFEDEDEEDEDQDKDKQSLSPSSDGSQSENGVSLSATAPPPAAPEPEAVGTAIDLMNTVNLEENSGISVLDNDNDERSKKLKEQKENNAEWDKVVKGKLILKQGLVHKKKGLFSNRRRMLILTEGPHLYYCDPSTTQIKGEVPLSANVKPVARDFKVFHVHTPNRTYYLEDTNGFALSWCEAINQVLHHHSCPQQD